MQAIVLGQLQLVVLDDGAFPFPMREFFSNVPAPAWRQYVPADEEGKAPVGHNCTLVRSGKELIVIDTGYGDATHGGRTGHMLGELARTGHRRGDVTMVVLTHAHGDPHAKYPGWGACGVLRGDMPGKPWTAQAMADDGLRPLPPYSHPGTVGWISVYSRGTW